MSRLSAVVFLLALAAATVACPGDGAGTAVAPDSGAPDPMTSDPGFVDPDHPPAMRELSFDSHGSRLNALMYLAGGAGPHPTILLLHGFPGNEKNLDLAQALRRVGFNVLFFHYRGSWGSGGDFSFSNAIEDVAVALAFLRSEPASERHRVDSERLILVGHSMGGFAALQAGSMDPGVDCIAAITPWNMAITAEGLESAPDPAAQQASLAAALDGLGPLRGLSGPAAVDEILDRSDDFDLRRLGPKFQGRAILLVGAKGDRVLQPEYHFDPIVSAYEAEADISLTHRKLDGDHAFSWTRIALMRTVTEWLDAECRSASPAR